MPQIDGERYSSVGRYAGALVMATFESIGGLERMAQWASDNPSDFFTKLFPKVIQKTQQVDVSGNVTLDSAIAKLQTMEADFDVVGERALQQEWDL